MKKINHGHVSHFEKLSALYCDKTEALHRAYFGGSAPIAVARENIYANPSLLLKGKRLGNPKPFILTGSSDTLHRVDAPSFISSFLSREPDYFEKWINYYKTQMKDLDREIKGAKDLQKKQQLLQEKHNYQQAIDDVLQLKKEAKRMRVRCQIKSLLHYYAHLETKNKTTLFVSDDKKSVIYSFPMMRIGPLIDYQEHEYTINELYLDGEPSLLASAKDLNSRSRALEHWNQKQLHEIKKMQALGMDGDKRFTRRLDKMKECLYRIKSLSFALLDSYDDEAKAYSRGLLSFMRRLLLATAAAVGVGSSIGIIVALVMQLSPALLLGLVYTTVVVGVVGLSAVGIEALYNKIVYKRNPRPIQAATLTLGSIFLVCGGVAKAIGHALMSAINFLMAFVTKTAGFSVSTYNAIKDWFHYLFKRQDSERATDLTEVDMQQIELNYSSRKKQRYKEIKKMVESYGPSRKVIDEMHCEKLSLLKKFDYPSVDSLKATTMHPPQHQETPSNTSISLHL